MTCQLPQQALSVLAQAGLGEDFRLTQIFPAAKLPHPLARPCIAVGVRSLAVSGGVLGRYWGKVENTAVTANRADAVLLFCIYAPRASGGAACYQILEQIREALAQDGTFRGCSIQAGEVKSDRDTGAFLLEAQMSITVLEEESI